MFKYIFLGIMILFCILFLVWGRKLRQGKWLRTMAGNNDNELPNDEAVRQGKSVGILLYVTALYILCVGLTPFLGSKWSFFISCLTVLIVIVSFIYIVIALKNWVKNT